MFISKEKYDEIIDSYREMNGRMFELAEDVHKDNGRLLELCKELLDENKALRAENVKLKQTKVNITQRELEEINRQKNELLFDNIAKQYQALRFLSLDKPNVAYTEICFAICKSGGNLTEREKERFDMLAERQFGGEK